MQPEAGKRRAFDKKEVITYHLIVVSYHFSIEVNMSEKFSRAGRMEQVKSILKKEQRMITSHELAVLMGVSPSWYWRGLFLEMWHSQQIGGCSVNLKNGKTAFYWGDVSLVPEYVTAEMQPCS